MGHPTFRKRGRNRRTYTRRRGAKVLLLEELLLVLGDILRVGLLLL